MAVVCPSCSRSTTVEGATFCMFCGDRLTDPHATISHVASSPDSTGASQETVPDEPPQRIGGYRITRHLGEGGMGTVFEAEDEESGKRVAVKLLSAKLSANPISVERFKQEGRLASQISHPRCVFVYRADADSGRPFIVMELMPGQTLKELVDIRGRLSPAEAVIRILDVVDGLIEAHRLGLIHRDVKPSNCFLTTDDRVKVGDFGLSKSLVETQADGQLTGTGAFLGTVLFAAPEQIRGDAVGYDSDVYSVCATLYFLLSARAPYQHESMTAALARAISEPPPSIRRLRPDVPKLLDRLLLKGLERDRSRRFSSLEELRDSLQQLLPEEQSPARSRTLVAAYSLDFLLTLLLIQLPLELFEMLIGVRESLLGGFDMALDPLTTVAFVLYFSLSEGLWGATFGKALLGLRVVPLGSVGPPGFGVATLRSLIFHLCLSISYVGLYYSSDLPVYGLPLGLVSILGGLAFVSYRIRKPDSNRGVHDLATGTHVVQLPRRPHRMRLVSHAEPRLAKATLTSAMPESIGGYIIRGRLVKFRNGSQVWMADDRSLGRRVLIHLLPGGIDSPLPPTRPTRLRLLGHGEMDWKEKSWLWRAYASPTGAPLMDMVSPDQPLNWPDARLILEQIVEERIAAQADGTEGEPVDLSRIWCEPGGRTFFLDFPVTENGGVPPAQNSQDLLRQAASLLLEGTPRVQGGPIRAPLPASARKFFERLYTEGRGSDVLVDVQCELAESHAHEPAVSKKLRVTQLGFAAMLLAFPMFCILLVTLMVSFWTATTALGQAQIMRAMLAGLSQPSIVVAWRQNAEARPLLKEANLPLLAEQMRTTRDEHEAIFQREFQRLSRPERYLILQGESFDAPPEVQSRLIPADDAARILQSLETPSAPKAIGWRTTVLLTAIMFCAFFMAVFALCAFLFRGGLSYLFSGVALVRRDGLPAGRFLCAVREIALWLPIFAVLLLTAYVQVQWPGWFLIRLLGILAALSLIVLYLALGIRHPEQGALDRYFGTYRVPA